MAEWLVEEGIGEHRAVLLDGDRIRAAQIAYAGLLAAGQVIEAVLTSRASASARGTARAPDGEELLLSQLPRSASEGSMLRIAITRAALHGPGRTKRAQGRPSEAPLHAPSLAERLGARVVRRFPGPDWDALVDDALAAETHFPGGSLLFAPTPAMTTVDIDGDLAPRQLALAAIAPLADALRRFDLGGSLAVDFPTLPAKEDRRAVDTALGTALDGWPHERTAMNGFGLVQLVARMERASLLHLAAWQRPRFVWHRLLRRAEMLGGAGAIELTLHPALSAVAAPADLAELERRTGTSVRIRRDEHTAHDAPHVQMVAR